MIVKAETGALARASILAPPGLQVHGHSRANVYLKPTDGGRFRWFREDGTPTVVEGPSVEQATHVAQMVWRDWKIEPMN